MPKVKKILISAVLIAIITSGLIYVNQSKVDPERVSSIVAFSEKSNTSEVFNSSGIALSLTIPVRDELSQFVSGLKIMPYRNSPAAAKIISFSANGLGMIVNIFNSTSLISPSGISSLSFENYNGVTPVASLIGLDFGTASVTLTSLNGSSPMIGIFRNVDNISSLSDLNIVDPSTSPVLASITLHPLYYGPSAIMGISTLPYDLLLNGNYTNFDLPKLYIYNTDVITMQLEITGQIIIPDSFVSDIRSNPNVPLFSNFNINSSETEIYQSGSVTSVKANIKVSGTEQFTLLVALLPMPHNGSRIEFSLSTTDALLTSNNTSIFFTHFQPYSNSERTTYGIFSGASISIILSILVESLRVKSKK